MLNHRYVLAVFAATVVFVAGPWPAANADEPQREELARAALERFLNTRCVVGEERSPLD